MCGDSGDSNKIDVTPEQNGGVLKEILVEGTGDITPPKGVKVTVHYVGKLTDGKQFDSSRDRGDPFEFTLGRGNVIKGWDVGVATMKKGEKSLLTCREDYAYGTAGSPPNIPPKATLIFEVELLDWEPEDLSGKADKGILRHPIEPGSGVDSPKELANVEVTLVGTLPDGKEFFNERLSFCLGEGSKLGVPRGVEKALKKMVMKEKSRLDIKPQYAFGIEGSKKYGVPPNSNVSYIVTLHDFEIVKDSWAMNSTEKLERAALLKDKGTKYFKDGDFSLAIKMYNKVVELVETDAGFDGKEDEERKKLLLAGYLNLSMTYLKMDNMVQCRDMCDKALQEDPKSVKALFRRGQALLGMKEPQLAVKDFKAVLEIEPQNKAAASQIAVCQQKAREIKENEKKIYANMFDKFARKDREWRYGWWDKDKPKVEEVEFDAEKESVEEQKKALEEKRKFIEMKLKEKREMERIAKESSQNRVEESGNDRVESVDGQTTESDGNRVEPSVIQEKTRENNDASVIGEVLDMNKTVSPLENSHENKTDSSIIREIPETKKESSTVLESSNKPVPVPSTCRPKPNRNSDKTVRTSKPEPSNKSTNPKMKSENSRKSKITKPKK